MAFWIFTDACSDLSRQYIDAQHHLTVVPLSYLIDGETVYSDGNESETLHFYKQLKLGKLVTTSMITCEAWQNAMRPALEAEHDVLCVVFSSALSGTYASCMMAADNLAAAYPERKIAVVDTLSASLGEGMLVDMAIHCRDREGKDVDQTSAWIEKQKMQVAQWFTVDDLVYLKRGGRLSATSAYLGGMMRIKPIMHVDENGKLVPMEKVSGRKRSLRLLIEKIKELSESEIAEQTIYISHGDCEAEALWMADLIKAELRVKEIVIGVIGPIIGTHAGPGTIAVFFMGRHR